MARGCAAQNAHAQRTQCEQSSAHLVLAVCAGKARERRRGRLTQGQRDSEAEGEELRRASDRTCGRRRGLMVDGGQGAPVKLALVFEQGWSHP